MASYKTSQITKDRIHESALELFVENGYHQTSLIDIAKAADVSTGTLYRYFPSKGTLLMKIGRNSVKHLADFAQTLPPSMPIKEKICAVLVEDTEGVLLRLSPKDSRSAEFTTNKRELILAYRSEVYASIERLDEEMSIRHNLNAVYRTLVEEAQAAGTFDPEIDATMISQLIEAIYFQELDHCIHEPSRPFKEFFDKKLSILFGTN